MIFNIVAISILLDAAYIRLERKKFKFEKRFIHFSNLFRSHFSFLIQFNIISNHTKSRSNSFKFNSGSLHFNLNLVKTIVSGTILFLIYQNQAIGVFVVRAPMKNVFSMSLQDLMQ